MKKLLFVLFAATAFSAFAADTTVQGYLVAVGCMSEGSSKAGFEAKHDKKCLQKPDCAKSGYGVLTADKKFIKFDSAGNQQATNLISTAKEGSGIKVTVTGEVNGEAMTVAKIELQ